MELLSLNEIAGGALQQKVNVAMNKVLDNMQDPNTPWKNKRQINIKISFVQNEDRDDTAVEVTVETKLAPVSPVVTRMSIGKDLNTGKNYASEYGKQVRGQMSLSDYQPEQIVEDDADTGKVAGKVVDLRQKEA